jgi:hypothetical protein
MVYLVDRRERWRPTDVRLLERESRLISEGVDISRATAAEVVDTVLC